MRRLGPAIIFAASLGLALAVSAAAGDWTTVLGATRTVESKVLGRAMTVRVHLPAGYEKGKERYPVFLLVGSEYEIRAATAVTTLEALADAGQIPAMILVGIDLPEGNGVFVPRAPERDVSGMDRHLAFIVDELLPLVDREYRTVPFRVLYGASNSGLFAVWSFLSRPDAFNATIASSPMLGWCPDLVTEKTTRLLARGGAFPRRWLAVVWSDNDYEEVRTPLPAFLALLKGGKAPWLELRANERAGEGHVPVMDVPLALGAIFPDYNPRTEPATLAELLGHYAELARRYSFAIEAPSDKVIDIGVNLLVANRIDEARTVFEYSLKTHPEQSRGYVGMGVVAKSGGDIDKAREWFEKALEVDPANARARWQLENLPPRPAQTPGAAHS
jgi:hypothetical protein